MKPVWKLALLLSLLACSHQEPAAGGTPQRVIIEFSQPRPLADKAFIAALAKSAELQLDYAAAISTRSAAYLMRCAAEDPHCDAGMARLGTQPGVLRVTPDRLEKNR